jgi:hypothetical protein
MPALSAALRVRQDPPRIGALMSRRNGDRARFHKNRKRKLLQRQRYRNAFAKPAAPDDAGTAATDAAPAADVASR